MGENPIGADNNLEETINQILFLVVLIFSAPERSKREL
jgi:hypothetical protein